MQSQEVGAANWKLRKVLAMLKKKNAMATPE
jgi:hypothetical protein